MIRVLDLLILQKDADGAAEALEIDDLDQVDEFRVAETQLAELLAEEDVVHLAAAMDAGTIAGVLVWENLWAAPFASAARRPVASSSPTAAFPSKLFSPHSKPRHRPKELDMTATSPRGQTWRHRDARRPDRGRRRDRRGCRARGITEDSENFGRSRLARRVGRDRPLLARLGRDIAPRPKGAKRRRLVDVRCLGQSHRD